MSEIVARNISIDEWDDVHRDVKLVTFAVARSRHRAVTDRALVMKCMIEKLADAGRIVRVLWK